MSANDAKPETKNDLYAHLGETLSNDARGVSLGTLDRVRAGYDFAEFIMPDGERVRRNIDDIFTHLENGYSFN
jgi:hypothetical protein